MIQDVAWFALAAISATIAWAMISVPVAFLIALGPGIAGPFHIGETATLTAGGCILWLLIFTGLYWAILRSVRG